MVGGYPDGVPEDPFALYVRRYLDLEATIDLFETRLPRLSARDIDSTVALLKEQLVAPSAVGDLDALRARVTALETSAEERKEQIKAERQEARSAAVQSRTELVEEAERISAQDVDRTQWKQSGQRLRDLLDQWKAQQRRGPRLDKQLEDSLWKRFSSARTLFDRNRRQYFAALDASQNEAKDRKEDLIARAVALQDSTDWGPTSAAYRDLMNEWRRAGRAPRKLDDALWAQFREAQQVFFDRRRANDQLRDAETAASLEVKEALAAEAEELLPIKNISQVKDKLRDIQDRWEAAERVPGREGSRVEARLRAVENALRDAEEQEWRRSNPETQARAQGMFAQLEDSIADLEAQLAAAEKAGSADEVDSLKDALKTKQDWLAQVKQAMS